MDFKWIFLCLQVEAKMAELKQQYDEKLAQKEELKRKAEHTELMLDRASKLVSGLAGERIRWLETVKVGLLSHLICSDQRLLALSVLASHCL